MAVMGRPKAVIDWKLFEEACYIQCTQAEICSLVRVNTDTLSKHVVEHYGETYSEVYKKFSDGGKMSLRRMQFNLAKKNTGMAIWLGKQYLGQTESIALTHASPEVIGHFERVMKQIATAQKEIIEVKTAS